MTTTRFRGSLWKLLAILFAVSLIAAACGDDDDDDGPAGTDTGVETGDDAATDDDATDDDATDDAVDDDATDDAVDESAPTPGGTVTHLMFNEINSLDPVRMTNSGGADGHRSRAIYGALVEIDNATGEITPVMAESLTPNDDFDVWTLVLNPGIVFTDGEPYDAEAVKFNWERGRDTDGSVIAGRLNTVTELNVIDDLTLEVVLSEPNASFDATVSRSLFAIGSPKAIEELGEGFATAPVGAGPFMLEEWIRDDRMTLVKNPDYFLADQGLPYLDRYILRSVNDEDQRFNTFNQGEAELIHAQQPVTIGRLRDNGYGVAELISEGGQNVSFNVSKPPFDDPRVRQAFMMSVDLDVMNDIIQGANGIPAEGLLEEESPFYADADWPTFDCAAAEELWAEIAADNGGPVTMVLGAFQGNNADNAEFMQASIGQCSGGNARVEVEVNESGTAIGNVFGGNFEAHLWGIQFFLDPVLILETNLGCGSPQNGTQWCNEDFDTALEDAKALPLAERAEPIGRIQQILAEDNPVFWYFRSQIVTGFQENIRGVVSYEEGLIKPELVWIQQ